MLSRGRDSLYESGPMTGMRIALFLTATALARGQEFRATLTGRVAGAVAALLNVDTNERLQHKSDGQGNYSFALIRPGNYELRVEQSGFKTMVRRGIILQVNQAATIDLSLTRGTATETVTVTDGAPTSRNGLRRSRRDDRPAVHQRNAFEWTQPVHAVDARRRRQLRRFFGVYATV